VTKPDKLILIDGNSLFHRAFYALPPTLTTSEGQPTNAVYGFLTMFFRLLDDEEPEYVAVAFDKSAVTFRHDIYADYKAHREKMPDELASQIPLLKEALQALNVQTYELEGYEADDLIGTLSRQAAGEGLRVKVVTGDRDALQLVSGDVTVVLTRRGITDLEEYDEEAIKDKYGVTPRQLIDVKGLMGDSSDNIPGVYGIGEKTAIRFIKQFGSLEGVLDNLDQVSGPKTRERLQEQAKEARLSKQLATIDRQVQVDFDAAQCERQEPDTSHVIRLFSRLEFRQLLDRFERSEVLASLEHGPDDDDLEVHVVTDQEGLESMRQALASATGNLVVRFEFEDEVDARHSAVPVVLCSPHPGRADVVFLEASGKSALTLEEVLSALGPGLKRGLIGHHTKPTLLRMIEMGVQPVKVAFDTVIAAYLLDPSRSSYHLSDLARHYLDMRLVDRQEFFGRGKSRLPVRRLPLEGLCEFYGPRAAAIRRLCVPLRAEVEARDMGELLTEIELPLTPILAEMEHLGIAVNPAVLDELEEEFSHGIQQLTRDIFDLAGEEFNINSTQQLGHVLFEKLDYPVIKKTKTGYSTAAEVLERLAVEHDAEIARKIMEYRELVKLQSTYIEGLRAQIAPDTHRIHTTFNQTVASTGRLSSTEPNLQNIPIRTELGRRIRRVFAAADGQVLVAADYSQIELRVLAHISGDKRLTEAFIQGEDIHRRTAAEVFGVDPGAVTPEMRNKAKAVNFGIVYGISPFGLANQLGVPQKEAEEYINRYFERYPGVREYHERTIREARKSGSVKTIFNRIRYLPELRSRVWHRRQFAERTAVNTPIQGSAADIIKLAMVRVAERLAGSEGPSARMLLQVHDELIFEVPENKIEAVCKLVRTTMEGVSKDLHFDIPLSVDVKYGPNWYDMQAAGEADA